MTEALKHMYALGQLPDGLQIEPMVERTRDPKHGDFACNLPMILAKTMRCHPRELAKNILAHLPSSPLLAKIEIAGPGFINFYVEPLAYLSLLVHILTQDSGYGRSQLGACQSIQVEFVSANPTGPLHVGHGRGAAYGSVVANLLSAIGFNVYKEYYVNDAGRQMDILTISIWLRYLELCGETIPFPANGYQGDYVWDIAATLHREHGDSYHFAQDQVFATLPPDAPEGGDKEQFIDALIARTKQLLSASSYKAVFDLGLKVIINDIHDDLENFGVHYDNWYSERDLIAKGLVDSCIEQLQTAGHLYQRDGAVWFRSTAFGDEKDRVLVRENGQKTYFASDIAYHMDKFSRGFKRIIDIWGADHHGYIPRVKAALTALGKDPKSLSIQLVQFAILYRNQEQISMSTRSGDFVTLRALRREVGTDAARFFYVMRSCEQHLDFDLELAKSESKDNPVHYIRYAHARVHNVFLQGENKGIPIELNPDISMLQGQLNEHHEQKLLRTLSKYPEIVENSALHYEPHQLVHYLRTLANEFHVYYDSHKFLIEDARMRNARLSLVKAVGIVLRNGLNLLGVTAPKSM
ncbi:arginine--tRNA ligase [Achromatium sp. WMS1]|nr:arginine--tRNA ligase [Achromatium sp. WMS1]